MDMFDSINGVFPKFIHCYNVFWVLIFDKKKIAKFAFYCLVVIYFIGHLDIYSKGLFFCNKINLCTIHLTNINIITSSF